MEKLLDLIGTLAGTAGVLLCIASALTRLSGVLIVAGSEIVTWFMLGVAFVAVGCFAKLQAMSMRPR